MFIGQCDADISKRGHQLHVPLAITWTKFDCGDKLPPGSLALYNDVTIVFTVEAGVLYTH